VTRASVRLRTLLHSPSRGANGQGISAATNSNSHRRTAIAILSVVGGSDLARSLNNGPQGGANSDVAVVVDVSQGAKPIHEIVDARSRRADHLGQFFLIEMLDGMSLRAAGVAIGQTEEKARQTALTGIGKLTDEIIVEGCIALQKRSEAKFGKSCFLSDGAPHTCRVQTNNDAVGEARGRADAHSLAGKAVVAIEVTGIEDGNDPFLALGRDDL
jgi:hypothetical protein